jgi:hypothetical protein
MRDDIEILCSCVSVPGRAIHSTLNSNLRLKTLPGHNWHPSTIRHSIRANYKELHEQNLNLTGNVNISELNFEYRSGPELFLHCD